MANRTIIGCRAAFLFLILFAFSFQSFANGNPWKEANERSFATKEMKRSIIPHKYRTYSLDLPALQSLLETAPLRFSEEAEDEVVILRLPMPNGEVEQFQIFDAPIMEPALAEKFPMIHAYSGVGIDDPTATLRFDVTQFGFHGLILSARHSSVYIDPFSASDTEHYISYYKKDFKKPHNDFVCHLETKVNKATDYEPSLKSLSQGDCQLRTYRLALSTTGEYATFHNGTVNDVMAAMNTTMVRVNGIFEREFTANMILVNNTENLIFLDSQNDPYDNGDAGQLINECHAQCDAIIGNSNYDIGHVFSTGGGGLAGLGVVCNSGNKGRGVTGTNNPVNDPFDVDYVAHEMGHQFGANHTFNNSCSGNRSASTAMEPGSGSTIMAYAGICGPNVQFSSDDYFHAMSIEEVSNYLNQGTGNSCAATTSTGNNAPTVTMEATNYTLPISTPFKLEATGNDADNDAITYCWEQMDNEIATMPPVSTNTGGPAFRSLDPTENPYRYFPKLDNVINGTSTEWEVLPSVNRDMNFRVTVRDLHQGAGCTVEENVSLEFSADAGPFLVEGPNTNVTWFAGSPQLVTWDVANTDAAPVNCANVDILLSTDGGNTYPTMLASSVSNTGSYTITVPNQGSTTCRVMVVCSDNIFYDISDSDFTIDASSSPTFTMLATPQVQDVCGSVGTVNYDLDLTSIAGFDETVTLTTSGVPTNATADFSQNNFVPTSSVDLNLNNLQEVPNGTYSIFVIATSTTLVLEQMVTLTINNTQPQAITMSSPSSGAMDEDINPTLAWEAVPSASNYEIEIATSPEFGNSMVETGTVDDNNYTTQSLDPLTVYYWRVKATNNCGVSETPNWFSFRTSGDGCRTYENNTSVPISSEDPSVVSSMITITDDVDIVSIQPSLDISHSWVGDISATIIGPDGTSTLLFDKPGIPSSNWGCGSSNVLLTFDDEANNTAANLENTCDTDAAYAIEGTFQPVGSLSVFDGKNITGDWVLEVEDFYSQDGGSIKEWSMEICFNQSVGATPNLVNNILAIQSGNSEGVSNNYLQATSTTASSAEITFVILTLPEHGFLGINGMDVLVGTTFTQADINNGLLTYYHSNGSATTDHFTFDVVTADGAWMQNQVFNINIQGATLIGSAIVEQSINCFGDNDGMIYVNASGSNPPFQYSIDGGDYQSDALFTGLMAGTYTFNVKDNIGEIIQTNQVILTSPMALVSTAMGGESSITVTTDGGTPPYAYSIGGLSQESNVFENLGIGNYTVIVTDANGCDFEHNAVQVTGVPLAASSIIELPITCHDGQNGIIIVSVTGGVAPFEYSMNGTDYQESEMFGGLSAGNYTFTVKDGTGNTTTTSMITLVNPMEFSATAAVTGNTVTIATTGGVGNVNYNINGSNFQSSNTFTDLPNGQFIFMAQDANGCETTIAAVINAIQSIEVSTSDVLCRDGDQGTLTVNTVNGGVEPYLYSLQNSNFASSNVFTDLTPGNYTVYIMDATGAVFENGTYTVGNVPELIVTVIADANTITATGQGGTGDIMYSIDGENFQESNVFADLPNGTYTVTAIDDNECTSSSIEVTLNSTALNDLDFEISFDLFPNPNRGQFTIELNQRTEVNLRLQIFDVAGKLVREIQLDKSNIYLKTEVDVSELSGGSYEVLLTDGTMFGRKRFVKM